MVAQVTRRSILSMQVCVPADWSDEQVLEFAEKENPSGTENGWVIRKAGATKLSGSNATRVICEKHGCNMHIMLHI